VDYTRLKMDQAAAENHKTTLTAFADRISGKLDDEGFPLAGAWEKAPALRFDQDWQGQNADAERETEVRLLWTPEMFFIRFHCRFRDITVFLDARSDGWRYGLWDRDVAETFLQPDSSDSLIYKEFEVSPNGYWIDLAVWHGEIEELFSNLQRRAVIDEKSRTWTAELAIPMKRLAGRFDPKIHWRVNFFRIEGQTEPRFYSAWSPTRSAQPNFHVPAAFGTLVFRD
jgi:alpha-galactosidase